MAVPMGVSMTIIGFILIFVFVAVSIVCVAIIAVATVILFIFLRHYNTKITFFFHQSLAELTPIGRRSPIKHGNSRTIRPSDTAILSAIFGVEYRCKELETRFISAKFSSKP